MLDAFSAIVSKQDRRHSAINDNLARMLASINAIGCEFGNTAFLNPGELRGVTAPKKGIGVIFTQCPRSGQFNTPANAREPDG